MAASQASSRQEQDEMSEQSGKRRAATSRVAGVDLALQELKEMVVWPVKYREEARVLGLTWPRGILLHGPPGTGKTLLAHAVAEECDAHLHTVSAASIFGAYAGESERRLRETFEAAAADAKDGRPSIIFIDEIDTLCPKRDKRRQQETRVVAQLLTLMDGTMTPSSSDQSESSAGRVLVVGATNRPNSIDPALRRPGRFDREISMTVPSTEERGEILKLHSQALPLAADVDLSAIASQCKGYVGADLAALCREAAMLAMRESAEGGGGEESERERGKVGRAEFVGAMKKVGPSVVRGATIEVPPVTWEDIGGLHDVKKKLQKAVEWPILHADAFKRLGLTAPRGVLLHGPPGCSKTTLARAAAHAANATLFSLSGAELYSMYVGEGEALLRETFQRARLTAPSIIFFDEADALAVKRSQGGSSGHGEGGRGVSVGERLLASLLVEMDGLEAMQGVLVLAATNRVQALDPALLRPGRFDVILFVPPPDEKGRLEALRVHTRQMALAEDVDLEGLAKVTELFTGAELAGLAKEAAMAALRESLAATAVSQRHFWAAKHAMKPSLTPLTLASYASFAERTP